MPISDRQLASILCFALALTMPIALAFMPNTDYIFALVVFYSLTGGVICFSLLA
jgi:hypothetical protein